MKIFLDSNLSKTSANKDKSLSVELKGSKKLLPEHPTDLTFSAYNQYLAERADCNKIRLVCKINPLCTNILFNPVTEIIKNEGGNDTTVLNYLVGGETVEDTVGKPTGFTWNKREAIKDTQLSRRDIGFDYKCGADIFNNHIIRNNTYKTVQLTSETYPSQWFNTIEDYMRDILGNNVNSGNTHLYKISDIDAVSTVFERKLIEKDGWFGFFNSSKLPFNYTIFKSENYESEKCDKLNISCPLNNRESGSFIDMYPGRDLFSFNPKYNKERNRIEKNWDYFITYPSSSTTENLETFLNKEINSLKAIYANDLAIDDNGTELFTVYSIAQHGLNEGDYVNIYQTYVNADNDVVNELIYEQARVYNVYDKFIFQVMKGSKVVSNQWVQLDGSTSYTRVNIDGEQEILTVSQDDENTLVSPSGEKFFAISDTGMVNVDPKSQHISFKRVSEEGVECEYYVRIFTKIPNFKYADEKPTRELIDNKAYFEKYANTDFENHINRLAFSQNIYSDSISEIVYTDDIDISYLNDNLGRPVSDIYLTIVKRNAGYKEWYGKNGEEIDVADEGVEISHCFGENTCGLRFSDEAMKTKTVNDVRIINNVDEGKEHRGLNIKAINDSHYDDDNVITHESDINFYGDLCCFSPSDCTEQTIQNVMNRFNTAQRELTENDTAYKYFSATTFDEIKSDDYSIGGFSVSSVTYNVLPRKEGYYYQHSYRIPVKTVSTNMQSRGALIYNIISVSRNNMYYTDTDNTFEFYVDNDLNVWTGTKLMFYSPGTNMSYEGRVVKVLNNRKIIVSVYDDKGNTITEELGEDVIYNCEICIRDTETPDYAILLKDGSCNYLWRTVLQNGFDDYVDDLYPFANGAIYIMKDINFYLKRQNPFDIEIRKEMYPDDELEYEPDGESSDELENVDIDTDEYFSEKEGKEC